MTAKEKLRIRVEALSEEEAERLLPLLEREPESGRIGDQIAAGYRRIPQGPDEDAWAQASAREAVRQEQW